MIWTMSYGIGYVWRFVNRQPELYQNLPRHDMLVGLNVPKSF